MPWCQQRGFCIHIMSIVIGVRHVLKNLMTEMHPNHPHRSSYHVQTRQSTLKRQNRFHRHNAQSCVGSLDCCATMRHCLLQQYSRTKAAHIESEEHEIFCLLWISHVACAAYVSYWRHALAAFPSSDIIVWFFHHALLRRRVRQRSVTFAHTQIGNVETSHVRCA